MNTTTTSYPCSRCDGKGTIPGYYRVAGGTCFKCGGSGKQAGKPSKSTFWAVLGHGPDGAVIHAYNVTGLTGDKAVSKARSTWSGASSVFQATVSLFNAFAVPRDEYWASQRE